MSQSIIIKIILSMLKLNNFRFMRKSQQIIKQRYQFYVIHYYVFNIKALIENISSAHLALLQLGCRYLATSDITATVSP